MGEQKPEPGDGLPPEGAGEVGVQSSGNRDKPPVIAERQKLPDRRKNGPVTRNRSSKIVDTPKDEMNIDSTGTEGTLPSCSTPPDAVNSEQKQKDEPTNGGDSAHEVELPGSKRKQHGLKQSNNKERPNLPRRASKRIAGIEVGPLPELKPNNRARRVSARRSNNEEPGPYVGPEEHAENTSKTSTASVSPKDRALCDENADEKPESSLDMSFKDLWTDPCIEFAIKTLTGVIPIDEEDSNFTEITSGKGNKAEDNNHPVEDVKVENNSASPPEFSFEDVWGDPCIEFAIKTLTGAIPVVDDFVEKQHLTSSSSEMSNKDSNMTSVANNSFNSPNVVLLQQFDDHRALAASVSPHIGNGNLQRSGEEMSKDVQRRTSCR